MGNGLAALFTSLAGLTVLMLAIPLVTTGQINGVFLALLPLTTIACFEAVQPLAHAFQMLESSQAAARRIFELIDSEPAAIDPVAAAPLDPAIRPAPVQSRCAICGFATRRTSRRCWMEPASACRPAAAWRSSGQRLRKSTVVNLLLRFWEY